MSELHCLIEDFTVWVSNVDGFEGEKLMKMWLHAQIELPFLDF